MSKATAAPSKDTAHSGPWWRHPYMWLVVGGPAVVVVAGFVTLYLAIRSPDYVYKDEPPAGSAGPSSTTAADSRGQNTGAALAPAMQARNHAATGGLARPEEPEARAPSAELKP
ncbi:MAG: nitrogen fixation protein FixH [Comamonadaceae bacterium]|nr:nitrogen fixation protein FixH [Comamonadaceae bacterium]